MHTLDRLSSKSYIQSKMQISVEKKTINECCPTHWHEFFEIEYIISGSGSYTVNGTEYTIAPGMVFLMTTTDVHSLDCHGEVNLINIMFSSEWLSEEILFSFFSVKENAVVNFQDHESEKFMSLCQGLLDEYASESIMKQKYITNLLECIIISILRGIDKPSDLKCHYGTLSAPIKKALVYIQENFREPITLKDAAKYAGLSTTYFSEIFKEYCGVTFKEHILKLRFEYAKKLLANTDMQIIEICYSCGFCTLSHFLRSFKKKYDITPNTYRKMQYYT